MAARVSALALFVLLVATSACGRSPAYPRRSPLQMVAAPCSCDDDDDDDDERPVVTAEHTERVAYVPMNEWQPPPSAQRVEQEVTPRGDDPPTYIQVPRLTLHRSIGEPGPARWAPRYWRR